jgi:hypothetical protein
MNVITANKEHLLQTIFLATFLLHDLANDSCKMVMEFGCLSCHGGSFKTNRTLFFTYTHDDRGLITLENGLIRSEDLNLDYVVEPATPGRANA